MVSMLYCSGCRHRAMVQDEGRPILKICSVDGCDKKHYGNGYCTMHRERFKKYGDVNFRKRPGNGEAHAFIFKAALISCEECVQWPFTRNNGYGQITFRGKRTLPSRAVCIVAHGDPPTDKHEAAHSCGKGHEGCVNPRHLRWATSKENSQDTILHGTVPRGEKCVHSRVTESQARFMIENRDKIKQKDIAAMLGVPKPTVCQIQKGKSWKWLTDLMSQENESRSQSHPAP